MIENNYKKEHRPWGNFIVFSEAHDHKVKRIIVNPGKRFSLQQHKHRSEHWFILRGEGLVTLDDKKIKLSQYQSINIPVKTNHRMENTGDNELVFIEIQTGDYFGEDDIERIEDDFGRA